MRLAPTFDVRAGRDGQSHEPCFGQLRPFGGERQIQSDDPILPDLRRSVGVQYFTILANAIKAQQRLSRVSPGVVTCSKHRADYFVRESWMSGLIRLSYRRANRVVIRQVRALEFRLVNYYFFDHIRRPCVPDRVIFNEPDCCHSARANIRTAPPEGAACERQADMEIRGLHFEEYCGSRLPIIARIAVPMAVVRDTPRPAFHTDVGDAAKCISARSKSEILED